MRKLLNVLYYYIILYGLIFVVIFYDYIDRNLNFSYTDEIFVFILFIFYVLKIIYYKKISTEFIACIMIFSFYLIYSFWLRVNIPSAAFMDLLIQVKPYIAFYTIYSLPIILNDRQKKWIKRLCVLSAIYLFAISIQGADMIIKMMGHPSRVATAATVLSFLYFFCSSKLKKDIFVMFLIFSIGMLSLRYKFFGFFMVSFALIVLYKVRIDFRLSYKVIFSALIMMLVVLVVLYDKIYNYTVIGSDEENLWARTALYLHMFDVLNIYIPFGSGMGTYGTWASGVYYSPLYYELGIEGLDGMQPEKYDFVADTYFPVLAQFGYIGIFLFLLFWKTIYNKAKILLKKHCDTVGFKISLLIIIFFFIESLADSTITNNRGVFMMIILAMFLSNYKINTKNNEDIIN